MRRSAPAFTLVEVAVALAIAAGGLVILLGIIPLTLSSLKQAADTTMEARIAQHLLGEIMLNDWDQVGEFHDQRRYFDKEGVELEASGESQGPDEIEQLVYTARIEVLEPEGSIPSVTDPAMNRADTLLRVQIQITDVPLADFDFSQRGFYRIYPGIIAKMDK